MEPKPDSLDKLEPDELERLRQRDPQTRVLTPREWEQIRRSVHPKERYTLT